MRRSERTGTTWWGKPRQLETPWPAREGGTAFEWGPLRIIGTTAEDHGPDGIWRHVSVSLADRLPSQREMLEVRDQFFLKDATVLQVFPPREHWVNNHEYCLHLWQRVDANILPEGLHRTVGLRGMTQPEAEELARLLGLATPWVGR